MTWSFKVVREDREEAAKPPPLYPLLIISGVVIAKEEARRLKPAWRQAGNLKHALR